MTNGADEQLRLPDAEVLLYRDVKWMKGAQVVAMGDRMIVQHFTGNQDDVVILRGDGKKLTVKRLVMHMEISAPSAPVSGTYTSFSQSFNDVPEDEEKRFLAIYDKFSGKRDSSDGARRSDP